MTTVPSAQDPHTSIVWMTPPCRHDEAGLIEIEDRMDAAPFEALMKEPPKGFRLLARPLLGTNRPRATYCVSD